MIITPSFRYFSDIAAEMRILLTAALLVVPTGLSLARGSGSGGSSVTQSVTVEVKPIIKLVVSGNPSPLIIDTPVSSLAGQRSVSDRNTRYSLTTNVDNMKIVASISEKMPAGTSLRIRLTSSKAVSNGTVDLTGALTPVDVVTGIQRGSDVDQSIDYTFSATADVGEVPTQSRTVTLTLTN